MKAFTISWLNFINKYSKGTCIIVFAKILKMYKKETNIFCVQSKKNTKYKDLNVSTTNRQLGHLHTIVE